MATPLSACVTVMMRQAGSAYGQGELGIMAKTMGGTWNPDVKLWYIQHGKIKGTELEKHLTLDA